MMYRVIIADDHDLFRKGIESVLAEDACFEVIASVPNGQIAVEKALLLHPDIVILDVNMPVMNGIEALSQIRNALPEMKVVMLTATEDNPIIVEALRNGACGFLLKNTAPEKFCKSIKAAINGETVLSDEVTKTLVDEVIEAQRPANNRYTSGKQDASGEDNTDAFPDLKKLTNQERNVLVYVAQGLSNKEIGEKLYLSENTIKIHIRNILEKLHLSNRIQAAVYAIQCGLSDD